MMMRKFNQATVRFEKQNAERKAKIKELQRAATLDPTIADAFNIIAIKYNNDLLDAGGQAGAGISLIAIEVINRVRP